LLAPVASRPTSGQAEANRFLIGFTNCSVDILFGASSAAYGFIASIQADPAESEPGQEGPLGLMADESRDAPGRKVNEEQCVECWRLKVEAREAQKAFLEIAAEWLKATAEKDAPKMIEVDRRYREAGARSKAAKAALKEHRRSHVTG
jgi:hypothetical protein